jgi:hypothetical protein
VTILNSDAQNKYHLILSAEKAFARRVALGIHVSRPLKVWHYLIPGMFIIDFLRRSSTIRRYSQTFLHTRKLALSAAKTRIQNRDEAGINEQTEFRVAQWLSGLGLHADALIKRQTEAIVCLSDHYIKLLREEGETYEDLIREAYPHRYQFKHFLETITAFENQVDQAILEVQGASESLHWKLSAEKIQVATQRKKLEEEIYSI